MRLGSELAAVALILAVLYACVSMIGPAFREGDRACLHTIAPSGSVIHDPGWVVAVYDQQGTYSYEFKSEYWQRVITVDADCYCGQLVRVCDAMNAARNPFPAFRRSQ